MQDGNQNSNRARSRKKQDKKMIKIYYNDRHLQIAIDNKQAENKKISDLIEHTVNYFNTSQSSYKSPFDYVFTCSCGYPFLNQASLSDLSHYHAPPSNPKDKKIPIEEDVFIIRKCIQPEQTFNPKNDIPKILKTAAGVSSVNIDFLYPVPKEEFVVSENLRQKLEVFEKLRENCINIEATRYDLKYKDNLLDQLKGMGFPEERCRVALRYCYNNVENAIARLTDETFVYSNYDLLKLPNDEVLDLIEFQKAVRDAVKVEFMHLNGEQLIKRIMVVMKIVYGKKCKLLDKNFLDEEEEDE